MSKRKAELPVEPSTDLQSAARLVGECAVTLEAAKKAAHPIHDAYIKADQDVTDATKALADAEEALLKLARQYQDIPAPEEPTAETV